MHKRTLLLNVIAAVMTMLAVLPCQAGQQDLKNGLKWMKSSLPQSTRFEFQKSKIRFDGCKHKEYQLTMVQQVNELFALEAAITHAKGKLNWGIYQTALRATRFSLIPRVKLEGGISFGAGMEYQTAPEFRSTFGQRIELPRSQRFLINSRFAGDDPRDYFELEFSNERWRGNQSTGTWIERGQADSRINFSYTALF